MFVMQLAEERGVSLTEIFEDPAWEFPYWQAYYEIKAKRAAARQK